MLEELLSFYTVKFAVIGTILLFYFVFVALVLYSGKGKRFKPLIFGAITLCAVIPSLFFIVSTVYLNTVSVSKGPVHWHADIEIWACGKEIDLQDPTGFLSNKIGTPTLHEHNDKRIHLEGVVVTEQDATLGRFFDVIGGTITDNAIAVPTNEGVKTFLSGGTCESGEKADVQVFVYSTEDGVYTQKKISHPQSYTIAPYAHVPEGDCVIVEYGPTKNRTDKLCRSYQVAEEIEKVRNGDL